MYPELGKAGQPYARTVTPQVKLAGAKPDAGVIFDSKKHLPHPTFHRLLKGRSFKMEPVPLVHIKDSGS
jgi:hypothetical protein